MTLRFALYIRDNQNHMEWDFVHIATSGLNNKYYQADLNKNDWSILGLEAILS